MVMYIYPALSQYSPILEPMSIVKCSSHGPLEKESTVDVLCMYTVYILLVFFPQFRFRDNRSAPLSTEGAAAAAGS